MPCLDELERFKTFVAGNQFKQMEKQSGVLVMGLMGSGKSTQISIQLSAQYITDEEGEMRLVRSQHWTPETSDGWSSKTLQVSPFQDPDSKLVYVDTAGLNENRGAIYKVWTSFSTCMVLSLLQSVQGVLVMVNYSHAFEGRGEGFRDLACALARIVGTGDSSEPFYRSMIFVFTNAWRNGRPLKLDHIVEVVGRFLEEERVAYEQEIDNLRKFYPKKSSLNTLNPMSMLSDDDVKWEDVPATKKEELSRRETCMRVLHAIKSAQERGQCMVSYLPDKNSCSEQRVKILRMIKNTRSISRQELDQIIKMRVTSSQAVSDFLASVLTHEHENWSLLSVVKRRARCMDQLISVCERNAKTVKCIREGDWKRFLQSLDTEKRSKQQELQVNLSKVRQEVQTLESSCKMLVFETFEVREAKSSGFFSWTILGGGWAERSFQHAGEWFADHKLDGQHYTANTLDISKTDGRLSIKFASSPGHDLHVDVKTYRQEKDHPGTEQRVKLLKGDIKQYEQELGELSKELHLLATIGSPEQLIDHIIAEKSDLERELEETNHQLQKEVPQSGGLTESGVLEAMSSLVPLLMRTPNGVSEDLAPAQRSSMDDFVKACEEVEAWRQRLQGDHLLKGITGQALNALKLQIPDLQERKAPVLNLPEQAAKWFCESGQGVRDCGKCLHESLELHPLPFGVAMLAVAHLMPSSTVGWFAQLILHFTGLFLICKVLVRSSSLSLDVVQRLAAPLLQAAQLALQQLPQQLSSACSEAVQSLAERLDVKVRMDSADLLSPKEGGGGLISKLLGLALHFLRS